MNDLISRQAAIDALGKVADELYENIKKGATFPQRQWFDGMAHAQSILEDLPSAQPEQKKGRWKYETMRHLITGEMRTVRICSVCDGGWFRYDMSDGVEEAEPNYCPNCGADMRGEEDDD